MSIVLDGAIGLDRPDSADDPLVLRFVNAAEAQHADVCYFHLYDA